MKPKEQKENYQWHLIFFSFILAALTGVLYRLGMLTPLPADLNLQNIRHAHSHLMFFGWATALPLYIMLRQVKAKAGSAANGVGTMSKALLGMLLFGLLTYPFFLLYGYRPVSIGNSTMPLAVIFSGLVMICWYLYIAGYMSLRKKLQKGDRNTWFEAALVMLFVSSLGAWGVAVAQFADVANPLVGKALTHFFLSCFTEGWVVLSVVGLFDEMSDTDGKYLLSKGTLATVILLGAPLTFSYGISETLLTPVMLNTARAGGLAAGIALCIICYSMLKQGKATSSILIWPLALLLFKGVMQVVASVIPSGFWFSDPALRIFYLHVLLLGAFTLAGIGYFHRSEGLNRSSFTGVVVSIGLVLISLLLLTRLWPIAWSGMWVYYFVAGAALLPAVVVALEWRKLAIKIKWNHAT